MKWIKFACALTMFALGTAAMSAQPGILPDAELAKIARTHASAAEHLKLAAHYEAHAAEHERDAKLHEALAAEYDKTEPRVAGEARHYAAHSAETAEALHNLAKIHRELANEHGKKK